MQSGKNNRKRKKINLQENVSDESYSSDEKQDVKLVDSKLRKNQKEWKQKKKRAVNYSF